jgi:plastocyanin
MRRNSKFAIGAAVVCGSLSAMPASGAPLVRAALAPAPICVVTDGNVFVTAGAYSPTTQQLRAPGGKVTWTWNTHGSADSVTATDIKLFDSGVKTQGSYAFTFFAAGTYRYESTGVDVQKGSVEVGLCMNDRTRVGTGVGIRYASAHHANWASDVQVKAPGATRWAWIGYGLTGTEMTFTPNRAGTYQVRARLRRTTTNKVSRVSPIHLLRVS